MTEVATSSAETMESTPVTNGDGPNAETLLANGKRNLLCGEVTAAVNQLQEACRLLAEKHGDLDDKCGDAYLTYGSALLELSRMESGVLGNALEGNDMLSVEGEVEACVDKENGAKKSGEEPMEEPVDATEKYTNEKTGDTEENSEENEAEEDGSDAAMDEESSDEGKKDDDEDVSNLQLAWEILELAKVIYSKNDSKKTQLKAASAYLKLGEVGLETESYEQAIGDFRECLTIQQKHLDPESRLIAETYYQIGLACSFNEQHDDAIVEYRHAVKTIETKIGKLEEVIKTADEASKGKELAAKDDPLVQARKEVEELRTILPDILGKIEDADDEKRNQDRVKELVKENVASDLGTTTTFGESKTSSDVKDISVGMVRKKRKPEDELTEESKKAKTEADDTTNGVKKEGKTNGVKA